MGPTRTGEEPGKHVQYGGHYLLAAVEYVKSFFAQNHLQNAYLIACQHILPSTHLMIRSMISLGLDRSRIALIGKCYSTNQTVMENMINEGIFVCRSSIEFDSEQSFDQQFQNSVNFFFQAQIHRMKPNKNAKIIILDDGGVLISAAQQIIERYPNICGVEQTSSGYHKLAKLPLNFPVVNVAQSAAKLNFESPLIAKSIIYNLERKLNLSSATPKSILLIGNGAVGTALQQALKTQYTHHKTTTYDIIKERSGVTYYPDFSHFDLIIGATGSKMINLNYYSSLKKGAVLASISSSDREFDAVNFRKLSGKKWDTHDDVLCDHLCLLNCGFPLNFSGENNVSIPLKQIQLVCALLFLGVCESVDYNILHRKFVELNNGYVIDLLNKFSI